MVGSLVIDIANAGGGDWPAGGESPPVSMERLSPLAPDLPENWASNNGRVRMARMRVATQSTAHPGRPTRRPTLRCRDVVINEVAWSGTPGDATDEWIELVNNTSDAVDLSSWHLTTADGGLDIVLAGVIEPGSFYLIERHDDTT